mgnify:CR=1 FL=1
MSEFNQLTSIEEAKMLASRVGTLGGGVVDIYIPEYAGPFTAPKEGELRFYHFKFGSGVSGFNAGLIRETMRLFPSRWPLMLATELDAAARTQSNVTSVSNPYPNPPPQSTDLNKPVDEIVGPPDPGFVGAHFSAQPGAIPYPAGAIHITKDGTRYTVAYAGSGFGAVLRWFKVV